MNNRRTDSPATDATSTDCPKCRRTPPLGARPTVCPLTRAHNRRQAALRARFDRTVRLCTFAAGFFFAVALLCFGVALDRTSKAVTHLRAENLVLRNVVNASGSDLDRQMVREQMATPERVAKLAARNPLFRD